MSKFLGKLLLESGAVLDPGHVAVKYVKTKDNFCFKTDEYSFYVGKDLCFALFSFVGMLDHQFKFSVGYAVREKKGVSEIAEMRAEELDMLGGRKSLILSGALDNDDDFDMLCVIHYLFNVSSSVLRKVMRLNKSRKWDRVKSSWLNLDKRLLGNQGRKKGSVSKVKLDYNDEGESTEDILLRIAHNKRSAVLKGFYEWYVEAVKEECALNKVKFDKEACHKAWNKEREKV